MGAVPPAPAKGAGSVLDFGQPDAEAENTETSDSDEGPLDLERPFRLSSSTIPLKSCLHKQTLKCRRAGSDARELKCL